MKSKTPQIIVIILLTLTLGGGGYWYYTTTPEYAIDEIRSAVARHDTDKFKAYVDLEPVSESIVEGILAKPVEDAIGRHMVGRLVFAGIMGLFKPRLVDSVKKDIIAHVANGKDEDARPNGYLSELDNRLGLTRQTYKGIAAKDIEDNSGTLKLTFVPEGSSKELPLNVVIHRSSGRWRVVELKQFDEMLEKLIELKAGSMTSSESDKKDGEKED